MGQEGLSKVQNDTSQGDFSPIWYVCNKCKSVFPKKHLLVEHKNTKHLDLINSERRQAGQSNSNSSSSSSTNGSNNNNNNNTSGENTSSQRGGGGESTNQDTQNLGENYDSNIMTNGIIPRPPLSTSSSKATTTVTKKQQQEEEEAAAAEEEAQRNFDDEVEVIFESAKVIKKLENIDDSMNPVILRMIREGRMNQNHKINNINGSKKKVNGVVSWSSFDEDSTTEVIAKLQVLGKFHYCRKCLKPFRKAKRLQNHKKLCHLRVCKNFEDFKSKYQLETISSSSSSNCYSSSNFSSTSSSSSSDYILVRIPTTNNNNNNSSNPNNYYNIITNSNDKYNNALQRKLTCEQCQKKSSNSLKNLVNNIKTREYQRKSRQLKSVWTYGQGYKYYLNRHLRIHRKPSNLKCSQCSRSLILNGNRLRKVISKSKYHQEQQLLLENKQQQQQKNQVRESIISCKLCHKHFHSKQSLLSHLRNHTFTSSIEDSY